MSQTMTAAERSARAKLAADARWEKQQAKLSKWHTLPLDEAMNALVDLRREVEDASKIIAERQPRPGENGALYDCYFCHSPHKKYVYVETPINKDRSEEHTSELQSHSFI